MARTRTPIRIWFEDGASAEVFIKPGHIVLAERAGKKSETETVLFSAFKALNPSANANVFDAWMMTVDEFEEGDPVEAPTVPLGNSSDGLPSEPVSPSPNSNGFHGTSLTPSPQLPGSGQLPNIS